MSRGAARGVAHRLLVLVAGALAVGALACAPTEERPRDAAAGFDQAPCERLLTLAPNLTELAFALGLGERVVGVSDYSIWPPEALDLPRVGGLFDPSVEAMISLEPDLALALPSEADVAAKLQAVDVDVLTVEIEAVEDVARAARRVAERCGVPDAGERLATELEERLAPWPGQPLDGLSVALVVGRPVGRIEDLYVAGPNTFLDQLLTRLGATNAFADAGARYPQVGVEEILARAPDRVVELQGSAVGDATRKRLLEDWQRFGALAAVEAGRIHVLGADYALVPGPRLPLLYEQLAEELAR